MQLQTQYLLKDEKVTGYYHTFARRLVEELKLLLEKGGLLLKQGTDEVTRQFEKIDNRCTTTPHARTVLHYIIEQFPGIDLDSYSIVSKAEILSVIETTEKFLAIFERKINGPIEKDAFTIRPSRILCKMKITTWGKLSDTTKEELLGQHGFGMTSLREVMRKLAEKGLSLKQLTIGE